MCVEVGFGFDGWNVSDLAVESSVVEPVDVFGDRSREVVDAFPWPAVADRLGLEERVERFGHRVVVAVALGAH